MVIFLTSLVAPGQKGWEAPVYPTELCKVTVFKASLHLRQSSDE